VLNFVPIQVQALKAMEATVVAGDIRLEAEQLLDASPEQPLEVLKRRSANEKGFFLCWFIFNRSFLVMRLIVYSCYTSYFYLVFIWWILGAVLNPDKMLPYAVMVGTFFSFVYAKVLQGFGFNLSRCQFELISSSAPLVYA
jgi:hypothetical protein